MDQQQPNPYNLSGNLEQALLAGRARVLAAPVANLVHPAAKEELTMALTVAEINRAWEIKVAAHSRGDLKPLSDFAYVQYAICTLDEPMEVVLQRMAMMQAFREEFNIQDTMEDAMKTLHQHTIDNAGFLIAFEYLRSSQNFLSVEVWPKLFPERISRTSETYRTWIAAMYYKFQAKSCQFRAIRNGPSQIGECLGTNMIENCQLEFFENYMHRFSRWYPRKQHEFFFLNSPACVNYVLSGIKKFLNPQITKKILLGEQIVGFEGRSIEDLYNTPTPEMARQRVLQVIHQYLQLRWDNEEAFQLPVFHAPLR